MENPTKTPTCLQEQFELLSKFAISIVDKNAISGQKTTLTYGFFFIFIEKRSTGSSNPQTTRPKTASSTSSTPRSLTQENSPCNSQSSRSSHQSNSSPRSNKTALSKPTRNNTTTAMTSLNSNSNDYV